MIKIFKSHQLTNLADKLSGVLDSNAPDDPLQQQQIIVPNLDTSRWLKLFLAEENGIAANLEFLLPSEWQWNQIRKLYPDLPKVLPSDPGPMKWVLYELLTDLKNRNSFPFLENYITSTGTEFEKERTLQLSGKIAWLFDQYQVYRPEMILSWQNGRTGTGDEQWQSGLWRMFDTRVKNTVQGEARFNRAELFLKIIEAVREKRVDGDQPLYVFNPGLIPKTIIELLNEIGRQNDVYLFNIQPSHSTDSPENVLVQSFGNEAGRVSILFDFPDTEAHFDFSENRSDSDLGKIQQSIVSNTPIPKIGSSNKILRGIEIRSCHSPVREIESLHQFLIEQIETDENLHPDDVLVVTPNLENYQPAIHAVFGSPEEELPQIPYHCGSSFSQGDYDIQQAFLHLLELADSRFSFLDVMDLFAMKSVHEKFEVTGSDTALIRNWMEENHVVWGLDSDHRREWNQPAESLQTWKEAMRRGWFGQWIDSGNSNIVNDTLLFGDVNSTSKQRLWAAFSNYLNRLGDMRNESKRSRSCGEWCAFMERWLTKLFTEDVLREKEGLNLSQILKSLQESCNIVQFDEKIGFSEIRSEITANVNDQRAGSANFNRGVVFSSMVPVRSIPFKVIALVGLNEESFPRKPSVPEFDLMAQNPALNDRNRKEEDRNLFLESVLAAGKVHYCSYIGQSPVDNESVPPSPVVGEWVDALSKYSGLKADHIIKKEPLTGFSPSGFKNGGSYSQTYFKTCNAILDDSNKISGLKYPGPLPVEESESHISADDVVRFFGNPVQWFLKNRFDARLYEPDSEKDEFETDNLEKHILFQRVFGWKLSGMTEQEMENVLIQSGALPAGWAGRNQLNSILRNVQTAFDKMEQHGFEPELSRKEISIQLEDNRIEGTVTSFSKEKFVDVSASGMSGKLAVQAWIRHLLLSTCDDSKGDSYLLCELKKGKPKLFRFEDVTDAKELLEPFVRLYKSGISEPQHFFPRTLYKFVDENRKENSKAQKKAKFEFEGGYKKYGERENEYISYLMGEDVRFRDDFISEPLRQLVEGMNDKMEKVK